MIVQNSENNFSHNEFWAYQRYQFELCDTALLYIDVIDVWVCFNVLDGGGGRGGDVAHKALRN